MCIAIPAEVCAIFGKTAEVEAVGQKRKVLIATEGISVGCWVLIYAGAAVACIDESAASETLALLNQLQKASKQSRSTQTSG